MTLSKTLINSLRKIALVISIVLFASCSSDLKVTNKIQSDIIELNKSTVNITSSDLRFRRYKLLAKKGNSEAMVELANSYLYEENIRPFDEKKAMKWLSKSAVIGNAHASSELAEIYSEGLYDGEGNVRVNSNIETSMMWTYIAHEQSKHLTDNSIVVPNYDEHKDSKVKQVAKQRAEKWLTANNT
ncbi:hypothetical protein MNBD_GAMMA22-2787 [hydrothermal vent metagenome]|uniref:Sel1 repeat family protein n=1 Tax=hydrothermal vent metagenome TaxID=652676 RepID=A0A3B1A0A1_9ZZZZ